MDYMERMRIQYEERHRAKARDDYADDQERARRNHLASIEEREHYVATHGRDGAFRRTLRKWSIAGAALAILGFAGSIGESGFSKALESAIYVFVFFGVIGIWRAFSIVNSVR